jgi:predicted kinase
VELVLLVGLQASGKSSFYRARFAATHGHVSRDNFPNNRNPARRQAVLVEEALRAGRSVVVDNTNPTPEDRAPLVALGKALGAEVVGYYFESVLGECLERNRARAGKARVPDVALYVTASKLRRPSFAEGFDRLYHVRMSVGGWDVRDWPDDPGEGGGACEAAG